MNWSRPDPAEENTALEELEAASQRHKALACMSDAFAEGLIGGIEGDCLAQAALCLALQHLVGVHGEDVTARMSEALPEALRNGEYSLRIRH